MAGSDTPLARGLALIFDMDGVLIDSNPLHREAWVAFNRRYGLETTEQMHQRMYGKRNDEIVRDFFGADLVDEEVIARGAAKEELYREMAGPQLEQMLVPGIREFLAEYRDAPAAVATNAEPANVEFLLSRAGLKTYFRVVIDGHQVRHPKPHPEIYLRASDALGIPPPDCIVFEDSYSGVQAALGAGMRVVGLATTHGDLLGTSITVDNFASGDLRQWLASQMRVA
jgi:beta-phosphoglucomutase family hydrolase